jgi:hypothetical protein
MSLNKVHAETALEKRKDRMESLNPPLSAEPQACFSFSKRKDPGAGNNSESGKTSGFSFSSKSMDIKEEKADHAADVGVSAASPPAMPARPRSMEKLDEIRNLVSVLEGSIEAEKGNPSSGEVSSITALIPGKNYLNFMYQLRKIGPVTDREKREYREVKEVRVTILLDYGK